MIETGEVKIAMVRTEREEEIMRKRQNLKMLLAIAGIVFLLGAAVPASSGKAASTSADEDPREGRASCCRLRDVSAFLGCSIEGAPKNPYVCVAMAGVLSMACSPGTVCPQ